MRDSSNYTHYRKETGTQHVVIIIHQNNYCSRAEEKGCLDLALLCSCLLCMCCFTFLSLCRLWIVLTKFMSILLPGIAHHLNLHTMKVAIQALIETFGGNYSNQESAFKDQVADTINQILSYDGSDEGIKACNDAHKMCHICYLNSAWVDEVKIFNSGVYILHAGEDKWTLLVLWLCPRDYTLVRIETVRVIYIF